MANQITVSKRDVLWNYAATALNSGIGFLLVPVLAAFLSDELLALWYIFLTVGGVVHLLDFGLSPSLARNMTNAWSGAREILRQGTTREVADEPNYGLMARVMGFSKLFYLAIAAVSLILLLSVGSVYIRVISVGVDYGQVFPAWVVFCVAVFLNVYYGYYATFLRGIGQIGVYSKVSIASKIVQVALSVGLLLAGWGLLAPAVAYAVSGYMLRVLSKGAFCRAVDIASHPELKAKLPSNVIREMFGIMWPNAWRDGLVSFADYLTTQGSTIMCSLFFTLTDAGIYAISMQFLTVIHNVSAVYCNAKRPTLQNAYLAQDKERLTRGVGVAMFLYALIFAAGTLGVAFVVAPFLTWIKPTYVFDIPFLLALGVYLYVIGRFKLYAGLVSMTNDLSFYKAFIATGALSLAVACVSLSVFGSNLYALIVPQLVVQLAYNAWKWPRYFLQKVGICELDLIKAGLAFVRGSNRTACK